MERKGLHIGPGAASLLLVGVVVSMCILGLLAMLNVRSDLRLTERSTALTRAKYEASCAAERDFARLDAIAASAADEAALDDLLPEHMTRDGSVVSWEIAVNDDVTLVCEAELGGAGSTRLRWLTHAFVSTVGEEAMDDLVFMHD